MQRVLHRETLPQELRVPDEHGAGRPQHASHPFRGPDGDRGLAGHHVARPQVGRQRGDGGVDVGEVGPELAVHLRRAHADEVHVGAGRVGHRRAERQPARRLRLREQLGQTGLEERCATGPQRLDLGLVDVDAHHLVAEHGHARGVDRTQVAAADDTDAHAGLLARQGLLTLTSGRCGTSRESGRNAPARGGTTGWPDAAAPRHPDGETPRAGPLEGVRPVGGAGAVSRSRSGAARG